MTLDRTVGGYIGDLRFLIGTQNIHVLLEPRKYLTRSLNVFSDCIFRTYAPELAYIMFRFKDFNFLMLCRRITL